MVFGLVSYYWHDGIIFYFGSVSYSLGLLLFYFLSGKIRQNSRRYLSFEGFLSNNHRFNGLLISFVNLYLYFAVVLVQLGVLKLLMETYFEAHMATILLIAIILFVFAYVTKFGLVGIVSTDKFQILGIIAMFLILLYFIIDNIALINTSNMQNMIMDYRDNPRFGWSVIIGLIVIFPFASLCRQEYWQRVISAESEQASKSAMLWSSFSFLVLCSVIFIVVLQLKAKLTHIDTDTMLILHVIANYESILIFAVLIVGLMLCSITSLDTYLNCLLLSSLAALHALTTKSWDSNALLSRLHAGLALLMFVALVYCLLFIDIDLNFWFLCAYCCAIPLLPLFIAAVLNKHNHLATSLSLIASFSFILYATLNNTLVESSIMLVVLLSFSCYSIGLCLSWLP